MDIRMKDLGTSTQTHDLNDEINNSSNMTNTSDSKTQALSTEPEKQSTGMFSRLQGVGCNCYIPKRYIMTFMTGLGMLLTYAMRTNVGVTVVTIVDESADKKVGTVDAVMNLPAVHWDTRMIGFLHSVFYVGYFISQIPGAYFTTLWPSNKLFGFCIFMSSALNVLLPISIQNLGYSITCVIRCCQGLSEGLLYPACYGVLRHWSAPSERSRQVSTVITCGYAGAILGFPVAGLTTHYLGWQHVYYLSGGACILWYLVWLITSYEKPSHHKYINDAEFEYLEKAQGQDVIDYENMEIPWREILISFPVLSICFCHFARHWVFILMLTNEPLYLNMFGFSLAETGIYASLPHIAKVVMSFASGYIADALLNRKFLDRTTVRKLLTALGLGLLAVCFMILTQLSNGTAVLAFLTLALGFFGLSTSGWQVNHYDLSTRYASALVAVTSTFGTLGAIIVPLATGEFTLKRDLEGWQNVFYLTTAIITLAVVFFLAFGSGEQQPWANPPPHVQLVQKTDPLARKPYRIIHLQGFVSNSPEEDHSKSATDKTPMTSKTNAYYGANDDTKDVTKYSQVTSQTNTNYRATDFTKDDSEKTQPTPQTDIDCGSVDNKDRKEKVLETSLIQINNSPDDNATNVKENIPVTSHSNLNNSDANSTTNATEEKPEASWVNNNGYEEDKTDTTTLNVAYVAELAVNDTEKTNVTSQTYIHHGMSDNSEDDLLHKSDDDFS